MTDSEPVFPANLWACLPLELVLLVLELLARESPQQAIQLSPMCTAVQRCVEPILYEFVLLRTCKAVTNFARTVSGSSKPPSFFQDRVKSICIAADDYDQRDSSAIISACSKLRSLVFWRGDDSLPSYKHLPLRKLSCSFQLPNGQGAQILDPVTVAPLFPFLTHLDLYSIRWRNICLPTCLALTHVSVDLTDPNVEEMPDLSSPPAPLPDTLKVLLLRTDNVGTPCVQGRCQHDVRIVHALSESDEDDGKNMHHFVIKDLSQESWLRDWIRIPDGKLDVWQLAEEVVEKRREKLRKQAGSD